MAIFQYWKVKIGIELTRRVIVHAPSIHTGGGKVLLDALLKCMPADHKFLFHINDNMNGNLYTGSKHEMKSFGSSLYARVLSEIILLKRAKKEDVVIFFGNLPPLFSTKGKIFIFVQNKLVVDESPLGSFPFKTKISIQIQRAIFNLLFNKNYHLVVQSQTMHDLMMAHHANIELDRIHLLPLVPSGLLATKTDRVKEVDFDISEKKFIYVASGDAHKNHLRLLSAWELLAKEGLYPKLLLTLDNMQDVELLGEINEIRLRFPVKIDNLGVLDHEQVLAAYKSTDALIFPSLTESFGLPLIEANNANLPIIASESDFVRDLVTPVETFDPISVTSIARAVKRYLGVQNTGISLLGPQEFLEKIIAISNR
jgi:glycosyltransferase involved in cell wall biosynthesis